MLFRSVVLGGASIFGGTGAVHGTLLGVAAVGVLTNGLSRILAINSISRELSGMLTGALLILALALSRLFRASAMRSREAIPKDERGAAA